MSVELARQAFDDCLHNLDRGVVIAADLGAKEADVANSAGSRRTRGSDWRGTKPDLGASGVRAKNGSAAGAIGGLRAGSIVAARAAMVLMTISQRPKIQRISARRDPVPLLPRDQAKSKRD